MSIRVLADRGMKDQDPIHWYAARVKYRTEKKIKSFLEENQIECYIPFKKVIVEQEGKRIEKEKPALPCFVFVRASYRKALDIALACSYSLSYIYSLDTKKLQVVPDKQMQDFMFLLDFPEKSFQIENTNLKKGDRVRVAHGEFAGIEGELIRIKGHKRVVVRLEGLFSLVTTYIPGSYLEKIEN